MSKPVLPVRSVGVMDRKTVRTQRFIPFGIAAAGVLGTYPTDR
ncbi:hypothetical protein RSSM_00547 [Rhodopirellula sallentina SM41]|uniref:Uncharacterized protein n=1 Tax=Rhodopirellula sallentina SM41 TaxID=1263870 RepID=M5UPV1_9BACT|nr:hypothetical protein RSSM_00547 [Rhodopirellula sallentina SM41]